MFWVSIRQLTSTHLTFLHWTYLSLRSVPSLHDSDINGKLCVEMKKYYIDCEMDHIWYIPNLLQIANFTCRWLLFRITFKSRYFPYCTVRTLTYFASEFLISQCCSKVTYARKSAASSLTLTLHAKLVSQKKRKKKALTMMEGIKMPPGVAIP